MGRIFRIIVIDCLAYEGYLGSTEIMRDVGRLQIIWEVLDIGLGFDAGIHYLL